MNPNLVRDLKAQIKMQLATFKPKKGKGRDKARPSTTITVTAPGEDLSYIPHSNTVLGSILRNATLVMDTRVPLSLMRSLKYHTIEESVVVDMEKHDQSTKGEGSKALKRRRRQEAPSVDIES